MSRTLSFRALFIFSMDHAIEAELSSQIQKTDSWIFRSFYLILLTQGIINGYDAPIDPQLITCLLVSKHPIIYKIAVRLFVLHTPAFLQSLLQLSSDEQAQVLRVFTRHIYTKKDDVSDSKKKRTTSEYSQEVKQILSFSVMTISSLSLSDTLSLNFQTINNHPRYLLWLLQVRIDQMHHC